jgi:hypothetical protein
LKKGNAIQSIPLTVGQEILLDTLTLTLQMSENKMISKEEAKRMKDGLRMIICDVFECLETSVHSFNLLSRWRDSSSSFGFE